ncbi:hypothetical protein HOO65_020801 [Ceratocystis lukuohia]|uniref:FHA domain-containing protein n=1 Tax=Ceratocystis lukuohia TaxID=2019550 RepID=A0ABR4MPT4_9PEZI
MTAVAAPPAFSPLNNQQQQPQQQSHHQPWSANNLSGSAAKSSVVMKPESSPDSDAPLASSPSPPEDPLRLFPRKSLQRSNSSSSISSTSSASSASSTTTVATTGSSPGTPASSAGEPVSLSLNTAFKKLPQTAASSHDQLLSHRAPHKKIWLHARSEPAVEQPSTNNTIATRPLASQESTSAQTATLHAQQQMPTAPSLNTNGQQAAQAQAQSQQLASNSTSQSASAVASEDNEPLKVLLYLISLNNTFERKTIHVPMRPAVLRIGRQTNQKTVPTPTNGYFDSKVLSRQHAEIWSDRSGKIWIRDVKSSNGTFVNNVRLSAENLDSDPHEIKTGDHLELGIDIIGEDGKTIIHHKVSAKVEHAGPAGAGTGPGSLNNSMDFTFNELDPAASLLMSGNGSPAIQGRPRNGSNPALGPNGRSMTGNGPVGGPMAYPRPFMLTPITTENIIKRLQNEIRGARLQNHDIERSETFINTLITKDLLAPADPPTKPPLTNGYHSFRADSKTRFSDPPAPPPQQPLPEKPTDVPSWKKSPSERSKSQSSNHTSSREPSGQAFYMQTEIDNYKKKLNDQEVRLKVLEETLHSERSARQAAEDLNQKLEEAMSSNHINGIDKERQAFEAKAAASANDEAKVEVQELQSANLALKALIETLRKEMETTSQTWERRLQKAEAEREIAQKSLAEMVLRIREESSARNRNKSSQHHHHRHHGVRSRSARSSSSSESSSSDPSSDEASASRSLSKRVTKSLLASTPQAHADSSSSEDESSEDDDSQPLVRKNQQTAATYKHSTTYKPRLATAASASAAVASATVGADGKSATSSRQQHSRGQALAKSLPYASVVGVVILGVGVMAFINGWQPQPRVEQ